AVSVDSGELVLGIRIALVRSASKLRELRVGLRGLLGDRTRRLQQRAHVPGQRARNQGHADDSRQIVDIATDDPEAMVAIAEAVRRIEDVASRQLIREKRRATCLEAAAIGTFVMQVTSLV